MNPVYAWLAVALVAGLAAFFGGRALRPDAGAVAFEYGLDAPVYSAATGVAARSPGGFDGLSAGAGIEGEPVFGGEVVSLDGDVLTLRTPAGHEQTLQVGLAARVYRLDASTGGLRNGSTVVVRLAADGETAEAVLIVSDPGGPPS